MDIRSLYIDELKNLMTDMGQPAFKAGQLFDWMHKKHVESYDEMTNLSKDLREKLKKEEITNEEFEKWLDSNN